jgi:Mlc titration factor MtfA (ptsG expression regulator)
MKELFVVALLGGIIILLRHFWKKDKWRQPKAPFPPQWRIILIQKVAFYSALDEEEKKHFEYEVQEFLLNCKITGIETTIDDTDRILVAASAVIPIFKFPDWKYANLYEVLIYPSSFNRKFETTGHGRTILGMVGSGYMEGKMILSKQALHESFRNESDKHNTAIHEFIHLIDKSDGQVDGVPVLLMQQQYVIPWLDLIKKEIQSIHSNRSDMNPYGATNAAEFFSVASEYFFERPKLLKSKHPELYEQLEHMFQHNMSSRSLTKKKRSIGRNSPCPCGSKQKFKKCCGKHAY